MRYEECMDSCICVFRQKSRLHLDPALKVLGEGLEPSRLTAPEPKSGVSANFTTRADGAFNLEPSLAVL